METVARSVFSVACSVIALMCTTMASQNTAHAIPVTVCGTTLNVPGGQYELTGNLTCGTAPAVQIGANGITFDLKGFSISGPGFGSGIITAFGHACKAVTDVSIVNGTVSRFAAGIDLCAPYAAGGTVMQTRVAGMKLIHNVDGMRLFNSNANSVHENNISANLGVGVRMSNSHANRFLTNTINGNTSASFSGGMLLSQSNGNFIESSNVSRNGRFGILIQASDKNTVAGNTVNDTNAAGSATTGIIVIGPGSGGNRLNFNTAENNQNGISLGCSGGCALVSPEVGGVVDSLLVGNRTNRNKVFGIDLSDNTATNVIRYNAAAGNGAFDGHDDQSGPPCGSNQWQNNTFGIANQFCVQ